MKVPVVLILFNRPDYTAQVWESIRQAQPQLVKKRIGYRAGNVKKLRSPELCCVVPNF